MTKGQRTMTDYKLVPVEPTLDMLSDGLEAYGLEGCAEADILGIFKAMIAAAPDVQGEPVAVMYEDGSLLSKADCGDNFEFCCKVLTPLYAAPQPAEQQPDDRAAVRQDKQRREDVAAALGFIRGGNYTWSYLLQQIKDAVSVAEQQPDITRLIEWDALRAECEKLRNLLRHAQPIIKAHAEASHMLEGFRPRRNQWDELVEGIDAAIQEESRGR